MKWHDQLNWYSAIGVHVEPWLVGHKTDRRGVTVRGAMDAVIKPNPFGSVLPQSGPPELGGWIVASNGSSTNLGTLASPWSLDYAITGAGGLILPGQTVWLRGGTYIGFFQITNLVGTSSARIVFQNYPGERAIIDGALEVELPVNYVDFRSATTGWLEIAKSVPTNDQRIGFFLLGSNVRLINAVVHDEGDSGIFGSAQGTGGDFYGNIVYNNGFDANLDHGMYIQNTNGIKRVWDNVVFNNYAFGIHCYGSVANVLQGIDVRGNASFMNGSISSVLHPQLLLGGGTDVVGGVVRENDCYQGTDTTSGNFWLGFELAGANHDVDAEDNWIVGGFPAVRFWRWLTNPSIFSNNRVYSAAGQLIDAYGPLTTATWDTNTYYKSGAGNDWVFNGAAQTLAAWRVASGKGATDVATGVAPTGSWIRIRPNAYEAGRAHVTIYNWDLASSVSVNLSGVLNVGDTYRVYNIENIFGTPVVSGIYAGGSVNFPMSAVAPPVPRGAGRTTPLATGPAFQVFLVRKS